ncbi:helix-turn-helix transcriptional regulator [Massilia sp. W12]|uniref:helix-turn-helix transcriptional regulator n=1 Tax=Massilia sp. W12 TaxID=3126507 RepID=UPI0030D4F3B3
MRQASTLISRMDSLLKHRIVEILRAGWRQRDLADAVSKSQAAVSKWSSGELASISAENAQALARLTGFRAEWIMHGHGEKYLPGGPVLPAEPGRNMQRYKRAMDENARHQQNDVVLNKQLQTWFEQVAQHDQSLSTLLQAWQMFDAETRSAMAEVAKMASLARPPQVKRALRQAQQQLSSTPESLALALTMPEIVLLRVFRAAAMDVRLMLVDAILEHGHGYQMQQMRVTNPPPVPNTSENLSPVELRLVTAMRSMRREDRLAVEDLVQAQAREMPSLWPCEGEQTLSSKVSGM